MLANGGRDITIILLTWTIWRARTNASKWRMGFNSAFKRLMQVQRVIVASDYTHWHIHTLYDSSGRGIGLSRSDILVQNTTFTRDRLPRLRRDSNQQSQQDRGRRHTPHAPSPPRSVCLTLAPEFLCQILNKRQLMICLNCFKPINVYNGDSKLLLGGRNRSLYGLLSDVIHMNFIIQNVRVLFSNSDSQQTWKPNIRPPITGFQSK